MKKFVITAISAMLILTSCNMSMGVGNYSFKKIHVDGNHISQCFTVEKWYDASTGIEVKTKEAGNMYISEGMYVLIEDTCPFCRAIN